MKTISFPVIGVIESPFDTLTNMPVQPPGAAGVEGRLVLESQYAEGLKDLDGFSHIYLFYHFHEAAPVKLTVKPFMDDTPRGVFSTRAPVRPSHLGMSVVEVIGVEGNIVRVRGLDVLNGTPLIDIKPYILRFDYREGARSGWMKADSRTIETKRSDDRFV